MTGASGLRGFSEVFRGFQRCLRAFQRSSHGPSQRQISSQRLSVLLPLIVLPLELSPSWVWRILGLGVRRPGIDGKRAESPKKKKLARGPKWPFFRDCWAFFAKTIAGRGPFSFLGAKFSHFSFRPIFDSIPELPTIFSKFLPNFFPRQFSAGGGDQLQVSHDIFELTATLTKLSS